MLLPSSASDPYYTPSGTMRARWPLSRIVRYSVIFTLGVLTGHGLFGGVVYVTTGGPSTCDEPSSGAPAPATSAGAASADALPDEVDKIVREAIRAEFAVIDCRLTELEDRTETEPLPVRAKADGEAVTLNRARNLEAAEQDG